MPYPAWAAAQMARLTATPTEQQIEAEVQRLVGVASPEDFVAGHQGRSRAFLRQYKEALLKEREVQAASGTESSGTRG